MLSVVSWHDVDQLFSLEHPEIVDLHVAHLVYKEFWRRINDLNIETDDEQWRILQSRVKRIRYRSLSSPLPPSHPYMRISDTMQYLQHSLTWIKISYPEKSKVVSDILTILEAISNIDESPLIEAIASTIDCNLPTHAIVVRDSSSVAFVKSYIQELGWVAKVVTTNNLKDFDIFDSVAILGPRRWFPTFLQTAPRSRKSTFICFPWIQDRAQKTLFAINQDDKPQDRMREIIAANSPASFCTPDDCLPTTDWRDVVSRLTKTAISQDDQDEIVPARVLLLEGNIVYIMPTIESSSVLCIDFDDEQESRVRKCDVDEIEPGMFLAIRTSGGGDMISAVADGILGDDAPKLRGIQKAWKKELRDAVRRFGMRTVVAKLKGHGSTRASEMNVRNWASKHSIKMRDKTCMDAILKLIQKSHLSDKLWARMSKIDSAHRKAGFEIRKLLLGQLDNIDTSELRSRGQTQLSIGPGEESMLSILRVKEISPNIIEIPESQTYKLVGSEDIEWLE